MDNAPKTEPKQSKIWGWFKKAIFPALVVDYLLGYINPGVLSLQKLITKFAIGTFDFVSDLVYYMASTPDFFSGSIVIVLLILFVAWVLWREINIAKFQIQAETTLMLYDLPKFRQQIEEKSIREPRRMTIAAFVFLAAAAVFANLYGLSRNHRLNFERNMIAVAEYVDEDKEDYFLRRWRQVRRESDFIRLIEDMKKHIPSTPSP